MPPLCAVCRVLGQILSGSQSLVGNRFDPIYSDVFSIVWLVLVSTVPVECDSLAKFLDQNISLEVKYLSHILLFNVLFEVIILNFNLVANDHFFLYFLNDDLLDLFLNFLAIFVLYEQSLYRLLFDSLREQCLPNSNCCGASSTVSLFEFLEWTNNFWQLQKRDVVDQICLVMGVDSQVRSHESDKLIVFLVQSLQRHVISI